MNFIKYNFVFTITFLLASIVQAQNKDSLSQQSIDILNKKYYFQMGIGYNFAAGIGELRNYVETDDYSTSETHFLSSYGKGVDISCGLGRKFTNNLGLELEIGYTNGSRGTEENQYYDDSYSIPVTIKQVRTYKANTFRINPKLVFEIPFEKGNAFYAKIGYLIGGGNSKVNVDEEWIFSGAGKGSGKYAWDQKGGRVSGSTTALGFRFATEQDVSFFVELTGNSLHRTFKQSSMTESIENNVNTLNSRPLYYREIIFVDNIKTTVVPLDITKAREVLAFRSNYSSVGFRIGFIGHF